MAGISHAFQIFVKPVGAHCNLDCSYCYYNDNINLYPSNGISVISEYLLEKYIIQHIECSSEPVIMFSWHGGEPTLAGLDFYRKVVSIQKKHQPVGKQIVNGIQTNATLLNDEWCDFLSAECFQVGVSLDGPEKMHNKHRISKAGKGSFRNVIKGYELLKKYNVNSQILCVVNAYNVNYPIEVYSFFKSLGAEYISFLPLVEKDKSSGISVTPESVPSEAFGQFLITIFDEWIGKDIGKVKIELFEEALRKAFNQEHTVCVFKKECGGVPVFEHTGDLYSCDHYVAPDYLLGNINDRHLTKMLYSLQQKEFGESKFDTLPNCCLNCDVLEMCYGECPKNRFVKLPDEQYPLNYLCKGYKSFFTHCTPFIEAITAVWKAQI